LPRGVARGEKIGQLTIFAQWLIGGVGELLVL
jgi:hypothetical protein